jgi:hypothetical protein
MIVPASVNKSMSYEEAAIDKVFNDLGVTMVSHCV